MKRLVGTLVGCLGVAAICGCASQSIIIREFYAPDEQTLQTREDGNKIGALKAETIRTGSPDWSDSKTISLISVGK